MNMRRLALSCRWLSSAILSVATLSMVEVSPWLATSENVNRQDKKSSAFDGFTPRKRFVVTLHPIVAFCPTVSCYIC